MDNELSVEEIVVVDLGVRVLMGVVLGRVVVEEDDEEEDDVVVDVLLLFALTASGFGTFTFRKRYRFWAFMGPVETTRLVTEVVTTRPLGVLSLDDPLVAVILIGSTVTAPKPAPEAVTFFSV